VPMCHNAPWTLKFRHVEPLAMFTPRSTCCIWGKRASSPLAPISMIRECDLDQRALANTPLCRRPPFALREAPSRNTSLVANRCT